MRKMSLPLAAVLLAILLVRLYLVAPAQQTGPPPSPPSWKITYSYDGNYNYADGTTLSWTDDPQHGGGKTVFWVHPGYGTFRSQGSIRATLKWTNSQGNPAPNPPQWVNVRKYASASASVNSSDLANTMVDVTGSDGLGHAQVKTTLPAVMPNTSSSSSSGNQYDTLDGSSGTVEITDNLLAIATATSDTATGSVYTSVAFTVTLINHAHPVHFRQTNVKVNFSDPATPSAGDLYFDYNWDSTSGNLVDLNNCTVGEIVTYSGFPKPTIQSPGPPDPLPDPPWVNWALSNPTLSNPEQAGTEGWIGDQNRIGISSFNVTNLANNPNQNQFSGIQYWRFHCNTCMAVGEYQNLLGPITMTRYLELVGGVWQYRITKSGSSAIKSPIP